MSIISGMGIGGMGFGGCMKHFSYMQSIVSDTDPFGDGSLIAKYLLDGDATDSCGNYDGTDVNNSLVFTEGKFDNGCDFGDDDNRLLDIPKIDNGTNSAFCAWVKWNGNELGTVFAPDFGGSDSGSSDLSYRISDDGSMHYYNKESYYADVDLNANEWYFLIWQRTDASTLEMWINGELDSTHDIGNDKYNEIIAHIGSRDTDDIAFDGIIDQVEIYNRALNPQEVQMLYTQSKYIKDPTKAIPGLVAHYPLNGTAEDTTGNYNGTENSVTYTETEMGIAASFDGEDDYIQCSVADIGTQDRTISCWVNVTSFADHNGIIVFGSDNDTYSGAGIMTDDTDQLMCRIRNDDGDSTYIKTTIDSGVWYHAVLTIIHDTNLKLTVNGILIDSIDVTNTGNDGDRVRFGAYGSDTVSTYLEGQIKNVRIYDRSLTEEEINDIYNYEKITRDIVVDRGLVAYYPLKNSGEDHYVNQYDGTDNGDVSYDGNSASFDSDGDYVYMGADTSWSRFASFTISIWARCDYTGTDDADLYMCNNNLKTVGDGSADNSGCSLRFLKYDGIYSVGGYVIVKNNQDTTDSEGNSYNDNYSFRAKKELTDTEVAEFALYTMVVDKTSLYIYRNGEMLVSSTDSSQTIQWSNSDTNYTLGLLKYDSNTYNQFLGKLANHRLYNRVLTPEEITTIYNTEKSQFE